MSDAHLICVFFNLKKNIKQIKKHPKINLPKKLKMKRKLEEMKKKHFSFNIYDDLKYSNRV